jgi:beta-lactamase regulating signal transducer with metallopeptidase domain
MSLASFSRELPAVVFAIAGKGALISLAALGVAAALRRASAASRHLVLALATVLLLLLPLMTAMLPSWDLAALETRAAVTGDAPRAVSSGPAIVLLLLPLVLSLLLLIRLGLAVRGLSRLRAGARPAPPALQDLADQHRRRLGIGRAVHLAVSGSVTVPVTFGWRRPVVLLPEAAAGWAAEPLREALVHELSHVRRGDWPIQMIARAACAMHWLDPFVWLLCRRLRLEAELACDDQVLQAGAGAEGYAERLVALARQVRGSALPPASAVAFTRPSELARRVTALLDSGRRRGEPGHLARAGAAGATLLLLLLLAPARLVRAEPENPRVARPRVEAVRAVLAKPDAIREGIEGGVAEKAVEQGVLDGAREGVSEDAIEDAIEDGARQGISEERQEAAEPSGPSGANPDTAVSGDGTPLSAASRAYAERLHRILAGTLFESTRPGEGC